MSQPPIPEKGLEHVLSKWIGRGGIWEAISAPKELLEEMDWRSQDVKARACRILLEKISPLLARWPVRTNDWLEYLPAGRQSGWVESDAPLAKTSWTRSAIAHGWPPTRFTGKITDTVPDVTLVTTLRWTVESLAEVRSAATRAFPDADQKLARTLDAAQRLLDVPPLASAKAVMPTHGELVFLRREGHPWGLVASVANELRRLNSATPQLLTTLLLPDDGIRWRLFHLAVLGTVLSDLRGLGCSLRSLSMIGGTSNRPVFGVTTSAGQNFELWFEAAGIWRYYKQPSPYSEASRSFTAMPRPLGADILLLSLGKKALVIECKYSEQREVVARNGFYQATTYAAEVRRLVPSVTAVAVGPEGVVDRPAFTQLELGHVGFAPPSSIGEILASFLSS